VVIIDHGGGWMSVLTGLADTPLKPGDPIEAGAPVAQAAGPEISVELRQSGRPFAITSLL
jgi:murein hydrolase activator